jgi:hypothetical protein
VKKGFIRFGAWRCTGLPASLLILIALSTAASAAMVSVDVVSDSRGVLQTYRVDPRARDASYRSYVEAGKDERYGIRITNNTGGRIGVVVAVDGRNIISGKKSFLGNAERMYILPPYGSATYDGWRTERDTVNRFYFTDPGDSYAAAFGDTSAMGVIAVAAYRERYVPTPPPQVHDRGPDGLRPETRERDGASETAGRAAPGGDSPDSGKSGPRAAAPSRELKALDDRAGTGFGEEKRSPSIRVDFQPESRVAERHFLKYEWRDTLCRKGIVDCRWSKNRFWDDDEGYAPYPPDRIMRRHGE